MADLGFRYWDEGPRDALPVVLLHAFPLHSGMWQDQQDVLANEARVIRFDVRGLGGSPLAFGPRFLEHWVDDLFALLDELNVKGALLCGLSMGGYLALRAIERAPERVLGLCLADTQAAADSNAAKLKRAAGIAALEQTGPTPYLEAFLKGALAPSSFERQPTVVARANALMADASIAGLTAGLTALATRTDCSDVLPNIAVPTRILVGEYDTITPPEVARRMAEQIPGADCHVLPHAGHFSNLEAPESFNALLLEHVRRVAS